MPGKNAAKASSIPWTLIRAARRPLSGFHDAPLHQDCRRYQPVAGRELGILGQLVPQAVPKETGAEQGMVDPAEPVEGQVPAGFLAPSRQPSGRR